MKKKFLASALALMVVLGTGTTAFAAGDGTYNVDYYSETEVATEMANNNGAVETEVTVHGGDNGKSTYSVVLPKTMNGTAVNKAINWEYDVTVAGDIAGTEYVSVVPDATFALRQTGKNDITASVTQPVTKFVDSLYSGSLASDTVKMNATGGTTVSTTGNVTASGITAGTWDGTFNFNVALN